MPLLADLCNFRIQLTHPLLVWFHKLITRYKVCILLKLLLSEKEGLHYHFGRIQFEDGGCTQATISVFNFFQYESYYQNIKSDRLHWLRLHEALTQREIVIAK